MKIAISQIALFCAILDEVNRQNADRGVLSMDAIEVGVMVKVFEQVDEVVKIFRDVTLSPHKKTD